jgi:hypothetical protein
VLLLRQFFHHGLAMKFIRLGYLCLLSLALIPAANANDFEAALSKETAQFTFRSDSSLIGWGGADLALGFFYNDDSDLIGQASLLQMRQPAEETPITFGVGVKAYLGHLDDIDQDVAAFAVGGEVRYTIPGTMPMALYARGFYAPDITSFADTEAVIDYTLGFQLEILPQTAGFVGIRHLEFDTDDEDGYDADDNNFHIGVRLTF